MRSCLLWLCLLLGTSLATTPSSPANRPPAVRPNIVFILIDDLRCDELSIATPPFLRTPHINCIGKKGESRAQGCSLLPLPNGERVQWRNSFLIEYSTDIVFRRMVTMNYKAVRPKRWQYSHSLELDGMDELYGLKTDPYKTKNLTDQPRATKSLGVMKQELARLLVKTENR